MLEAALREGVGLPYGCRNGACGACKGVLRSGELEYGEYQERALHHNEKAAGKALTCCTRPLTDIVFEVREISGAKDLAIRTMPARVERLEKPADDVAVLNASILSRHLLHAPQCWYATAAPGGASFGRMHDRVCSNGTPRVMAKPRSARGSTWATQK